MRTLVLTLLICALPGCSLIFVEGPPDPLPPPTAPSIPCTTSRVAPVLDTVGAVPATGGVLFFGYAAVAIAGQDDTETWASGFAVVGALISAAIAAPYWWSAVRGYRQTGACRRWHDEHRRAQPPASVAPTPGAGI